jgi:hypothetical protein
MMSALAGAFISEPFLVHLDSSGKPKGSEDFSDAAVVFTDIPVKAGEAEGTTALQELYLGAPRGKGGGAGNRKEGALLAGAKGVEGRLRGQRAPWPTHYCGLFCSLLHESRWGDGSFQEQAIGGGYFPATFGLRR